jgi:TonB family protein
MQYLFQSTIYTALFYTVYQLFLKNRASHQWSRFYLLQCAIMPLVIPLIKLPGVRNTLPVGSGNIGSILLPAMTVFSDRQAVAAGASAGLNLWIVVYAAVGVAILAWSGYQFLSFRRFVKQHKPEQMDGVTVLTGTNAGPGSFLNYIFLPGREVDQAIFDHELAHIRHRHSLDILLLRLLQCIFWPNFVLYLILKELKIVHEFQADAYAVKNEASYTNALLNEIFNTRQFTLSHTFFYHPLKRRIMMLHNPVSRTRLRRAQSKAIVVAAFLLAGFIYLQSCSHAENKSVLPQSAGTDDASIERNAKMVDGKKIYPFVKTMPTTDYDLHQFLASNMKYPEEARTKGIEGRVTVRFVVDEAGNVINPSILRSPDTILSQEALRVMGLMPKWQPGVQNGKRVAVFFTLPMVFMLDPKGPGSSNGLSKPENDTMTQLLGRAQNNGNMLNLEESKTMARLMQKAKK